MSEASANDGFKRVRSKERIGKHVFMIKDGGQVTFSRAFWTSKLISKDESTFFEVLWNDKTEELRVMFFSEAEMKSNDPKFDPDNLKDVFDLDAGDLAKGMRVAIREDISPKLLPKESHWFKWEEGDGLTYNKEERHMTIATKGKRQVPNTKLQNEIDDGKDDAKAYAEKIRMLQEHEADPKGFMDQIQKGKYTQEEVEDVIELKEQFEIIRN